MTKKINEQGVSILRNPLLNKGTAFSSEEKATFNLYGLLPPCVETIEEQVARAYDSFRVKQNDLEKHIYLRGLQDRNEVLFYRLILDHLIEMMPIIYTPVVGEACEQFHHIYREPRGLTLSYPEADQMDNVLKMVAKTRDIRVIVVTDGERILGLGDQGTGGLGIPIGKLSLYTACGGINPAFTLPIVLDVGTNNQERLKDPEYLGWRNERITGKAYDDFIDQFVTSIKRHLPHVLLQFEDFAQQHAYPILLRYRDQLCTFNDDIQGTAAVVVAAVLAATNVAKIQLKDQRIALLGAGSAGCGISEQLVNAMVLQGLTKEEAYARFYLVDRNGLLQDDMNHLLPFQTHFATKKSVTTNWNVADKGNITLAEVIHNARPTILLGVSGQPNQFKEAMIRDMASFCKRPIIFPLSNPTSKAEAVPNDLLHWTDGQALVATGSPFDPITINGRTIPIAQCNNSYIFPGAGLAVVASKAKRVTDKMMMAAAMALSDLAPAMETGVGALLPVLTTIRSVSKHIAKGMILEGIKEGHIPKMSEKEIEVAIEETMWSPEYEEFIR